MSTDKLSDSFPALQRALDCLGMELGVNPDRRSRGRSLDRHSRRCMVCNHPEREAIEQAFLRWTSPEKIARQFGIADHSSVYRHVHATGLFSRRRGYVRLALEPILEKAASVKVTARAVISAVRTYACLSDDGRWVGPARSHVVSRENASESGSNLPETECVTTCPPPVPGSTAASPEPSPAVSPISNSQPARLDYDATP